MKQLSFDEMRELLSDQIRRVSAREGNLETELDVADSLSNMVGKMMLTHLVEIKRAAIIDGGMRKINSLDKK